VPCKTVTRVSVPFTEGHYYGKGKRPNTELADNSPFTSRRKIQEKNTSEYKLREQVIVKIMTTILNLYIFSAEPRTCTIQLIKRILNKGAGGQEQRCLPKSLI
jgi:hypothetical protein